MFFLCHALFPKQLKPRTVTRMDEQSEGWIDSAIGVTACWTYVHCT